MKRKNIKKKNKLLSELENNPLITRACSKLRISRASYYRWREEDPVFRAEIYRALDRGREKICDFAESKLYENVSNNDRQSIFFVLRHYSKHFRPHGLKLYIEENIQQEEKIRRLQVMFEELIASIGVDTALRMVGQDPEKFKANVKREIERQRRESGEL